MKRVLRVIQFSIVQDQAQDQGTALELSSRVDRDVGAGPARVTRCEEL